MRGTTRRIKGEREIRDFGHLMMAPATPVAKTDDATDGVKDGIGALPMMKATPSTAATMSPGSPSSITAVHEIRRSNWIRPDALLAKLPATWSVLDMWKLPDNVPEDAGDHATLLAGLARTPADGAFAPNALTTEAPLSTTDEVIAIVALAAFFTAPAFGPAGVIVSIVAACYGRLLLALALLAMIAWLCVWIPSPRIGAKHNHIVRAIYRYFSFRICFSPHSKYTADRPYIHVCAPHALFPIGGFLWQLSPYKTSRYHGRAAVASAVTRLPLWRQLFYLLGTVPADRNTMASLLARGYSTGVAIDGIAGIFADAARPHSSPAVVMKSRKGIVRLAIQHGTPLVPVYSFVSRRPLRNWLGASGEWISRCLKISLVLPYGRFGPGLPPVPRRAVITTVVGDPVEVGPACASPSEEVVNAIHAQLCDAMVAVFDVHKEAVGWGGRTLELI